VHRPLETDDARLLEEEEEEEEEENYNNSTFESDIDCVTRFHGQTPP